MNVDIDAVQAERRVQELRGLSLNLEQSETRGLQAESPADDLCSLSLNLEPAEPIVVHVPRMNGARNSDSRDSSDCGSPSSTEPLLPRHLELPEILTDQAPTFTAGDTDRRNDFYCLKRFVFLSFGVPDAPALSSRRVQKCISKSRCMLDIINFCVHGFMHSWPGHTVRQATTELFCCSKLASRLTACPSWLCTQQF